MNSKKNNVFRFLLAAVLLLFGFAACSSPDKLPRLAADAVVVAFGDSITFGTGANPQESYPAVLEKLIGRRIINAGVQKGVAVVIIAVPSPGIFVSPASFYLDIAKELTIPLEENTLSLVLADGSLKSDYIHPNAAGYSRLAEAIAVLLKKNGAIN
ncbi:MAG: lysophospholipase L1-like esterase [Syntrophaceae bacterium]|nr:MAG: lysophospholipase L1-like esterase [Syntrophaceae bacterium]